MSRLVAQQLRRAALIDGDVVNEIIVSGRVWALGEPADEAFRQVQLCIRNVCTLAANFVDAGFTAVIDTVVPDRKQLDFFLSALRPHRVDVVVLAPSIDVCRQRNATRAAEDQFFFDDYEALTAAMRDAFGEVGWWFDTSTLTPEETARQVLDTVAGIAFPGR